VCVYFRRLKCYQSLSSHFVIEQFILLKNREIKQKERVRHCFLADASALVAAVVAAVFALRLPLACTRTCTSVW